MNDFDRFTKHYQLAVKEMYRAFENLQLRPRIESIHPGDGFIDIDEFILIALQNQPRTVGLPRQGCSEPRYCGCNADQSGRSCARRRAWMAIAAPNENPEIHNGRSGYPIDKKSIAA